jgi:predicted methyltransferase
VRITSLLVLAASTVLAPLACGGGAAGVPAAPVAGPTAGSSAPSPAALPEDPALARYRAILAAPDRGAADRALDAGRHPVELLAFAKIHEGMRVAEIGAWKGYTAELLANAVGATGRVYAQDPPAFDKWTRASWAERAARPAVRDRVTRVARAFDDPLPADARELDAVFIVLFYHDTVWLQVDRDRMNRAIFAALKRGGSLLVVDHRAPPGSGLTVAEKLHRIEESTVRREIEQAGFQLAGTADFLANPADPRDWNSNDEAPAEKRGTSDRFVLSFVKP